ncbi:4574_t:CDS:2 [Ambispora gerdemannii]|uniref:4574_t:CDS:1 n=1 Tax=Ambispora gerdemannii TaxID=144530 RepID=A0A9N9CRC8_9GLOM|nr:4574_t:CDS:2 [Ambispora gerdemannii]
MLEGISNDSKASQEVRARATKLLQKKKVDGKTRAVLVDTTSHYINTSPSSSSASVSNRKRNAIETIDTSSGKRQCVVPDIEHLFPGVDVPLRVDKSTNILEVLKLAIRTFDQATITLASVRAYKESNHLRVDSETNAKVPRESVYDAEMYRVLLNWLKIIHKFEITGQWHLGQVCEDGDYHHLYCDLTIKKSDSPNPVAVLELLATASPPKLDSHFEQVFKYAQQLNPLEVWVVHFSREDGVVENPYWPCKQLQERGLNVVHLWHDKEFKNVRMSARSRDASGNFYDIIDEQILP